MLMVFIHLTRNPNMDQKMDLSKLSLKFVKKSEISQRDYFLDLAEKNGYVKKWRQDDVLISENSFVIIELKYGKMKDSDKALIDQSQLRDIAKHVGRITPPVSRLIFFDAKGKLLHEYYYFEQFRRNVVSSNGYFVFCGYVGDIYEFYKGIFLRRFKVAEFRPSQSGIKVDQEGTVFCIANHSSVIISPLSRRETIFDFPDVNSGVKFGIDYATGVGDIKEHLTALGISDKDPEQLTMSEVKDHYRNLMKKYHPDVVGQEGHDITVRINLAYATLVNMLSKEEMPNHLRPNQVYDYSNLKNKKNDKHDSSIALRKTRVLKLPKKYVDSQFFIIVPDKNSVYLTGFAYVNTKVVVLDLEGNLLHKINFKTDSDIQGNRSFCLLEPGTFALGDYGGRIHFVKDFHQIKSVEYDNGEMRHYIEIRKGVVNDKMYYIVYTSAYKNNIVSFFDLEGNLIVKTQIDDEIISVDVSRNRLFVTANNDEVLEFEMN